MSAKQYEIIEEAPDAWAVYWGDPNDSTDKVTMAMPLEDAKRMCALLEQHMPNGPVTE